MESNENIEKRIHTAARKLFIEKGYLNTNMSDIAVAAGIKRPTLHYYFRTKERLFQSIYGNILQAVIPRIHGILSQDIPFIDRLSDVTDEYFALFRKNPDLPQFIIGEIQRDINHLIVIAKQLGVDEYILKIKAVCLDDMEKGAIKTVPVQDIFLTFYSLMLFPFLTKNLITHLLIDERFEDFLKEWKQNIMRQMRHLLDTNDRK